MEGEGKGKARREKKESEVKEKRKEIKLKNGREIKLEATLYTPVININGDVLDTVPLRCHRPLPSLSHFLTY